MKITLLVVLALSVVLSVSARAEVRFSVDPGVAIDQLTASGETVVRTTRSGATYGVEASAVVDAPDRLLEAAVAVDRHVEMGMPLVVEAEVVERSADRVLAWMHLAAVGVDSKHFLEFRLHHGIDRAGAIGAEWRMVPGNGELPELSAFDRIEGSTTCFRFRVAAPTSVTTRCRGCAAWSRSS